MSEIQLEVQNLTKSYQQGETHIEVLRGLSMQIKSGEKVAIVGQSGSGKSTLLSLLAGLDLPDQGLVQIAGQNLATLSPSARSHFRGQNIGFVFQQYHLLAHLTALENVMLPLEINNQELKSAKDQSQVFLRNVGLESRMNHLPSQLSGGERQRVALARALVSRPKIILADEPTGSLDARTGALVMDLLFQQVNDSNLTLLLVTHSIELAGRCQRTLQMTEGKLTAS